MPPKIVVPTKNVYPANGYSQAIRVGPLLVTAGIVAHDTEGHIVGKGDIAAQVEQVFQNLGAVLTSAGLGFEYVVKITIFTTNVLFRPRIMEARRKYFPVDPPVSTFFVVSSLSTADQLVEIEAMAAVRE